MELSSLFSLAFWLNYLHDLEQNYRRRAVRVQSQIKHRTKSKTRSPHHDQMINVFGLKFVILEIAIKILSGQKIPVFLFHCAAFVP